MVKLVHQDFLVLEWFLPGGIKIGGSNLDLPMYNAK